MSHIFTFFHLILTCESCQRQHVLSPYNVTMSCQCDMSQCSVLFCCEDVNCHNVRWQLLYHCLLSQSSVTSFCPKTFNDVPQYSAALPQCGVTMFAYKCHVTDLCQNVLLQYSAITILCQGVLSLTILCFIDLFFESILL